METDNQGVATCEICHIEMQKKESDVKDLDINKISLLAMFGIQKFFVLQCPTCHKTGLHI